MSKAIITKDIESAIYTLGKYECEKCGYKFLARTAHPCPKCQPAKLRKWKKQYGIE